MCGYSAIHLRKIFFLRSIDADGKEDKVRSRRVVFKIRVRSLEQRQLEKRLNQLT